MKLYYYTREPYSVEGSEVAAPTYMVATEEKHETMFETCDKELAKEIVLRVNNHTPLILAIANMLKCMEANDGDSLANAAQDAIKLLDKIETTT